jgi:GH25 family lysozyme M1 (1,4-beta-N-acetylmuramidase)
MTYGIDISKYQNGMNLGQAKAEGVEFVIVKASGFNTGSLYVADGYGAHVANARAALLPVGHYYVPGRGDVIQQADWFVDHVSLNPAHDVLALDNEPLDANATFWRQDDCLTFLNRVQARTGINPAQEWLYSPAAQTRNNGPWDKITNTPIRVWWSAYGLQPTSRFPDHSPALAGQIARWDVHQFSSVQTIAGFPNVDGNFSYASVEELFGAPVAPPPPPPPPPTWSYWEPPKGMGLALRIQKALKARGRYSGLLDDEFGPLTRKGVQLTIRGVGYTGLIDGDIREWGCELIQRYAQRFGSYTGPIDKAPRWASWSGFALGLERP